jgi:hypothetical protein
MAAERPAPTDGLFDTSPRALASRFGELAVRRIQAGHDPREAVKLAAHFAAEALADDANVILPFVARTGGIR